MADPAALVLAAVLARLGEPSAGASPPLDRDWLSVAGSGLLTLPDTTSLPARRVSLAFALDNRDRDPLGLDLLDGSFTFAAGLGRGLEAYGSYVVSRVVALPEPPTLPPPPLDVIVPPGGRVPPRPYYALYAPTPYVNKRGTARFDDWVPGDLVLGVKRRFATRRGRRPAVAAALELKAPLRKRLADLQSGSGTGGVDLAARLAAEWRVGRHALIASASYSRTGGSALGDRLLLTDGAGGLSVRDEPLALPDRVQLGLGLRRPLGRRAAAVAEASTEVEVGGRTPVVDASRPLDVLAGVQLRLGRARVTGGLRYQAHALPSGATRAAPLAGLVDLTDVPAGELAAYLDRVGAGSAGVGLRPGAQRLLALPGPHDGLPAGARVIPASYRIRSEHQVGFVLLWGWAF
jgi:hypothetical protein